MSQQEFVPQNELESVLLKAQQGSCPASDFLDKLLSSKVFVLLDKEIGPEGRWDPSINPCILNNAARAPVLAAFTTPELATPWHERLPQFGYGLLVNFAWVLQGLRPQVGVVINPGHKVGVELTPEAIARLKQQAAGNVPAT